MGNDAIISTSLPNSLFPTCMLLILLISAGRDPIVLGVAEQMTVIDGKGWTKASLSPASGRKLTGQFEVKGNTVRYRKTKNADPAPVKLSDYTEADFGKPKSKAIKAAEKALKAWNLNDAIPLFEQAIKESGKHPAALLALKEAQAIKAALDAVRDQLTPSKENATSKGYLKNLALLIEITKPKSWMTT